MTPNKSLEGEQKMRWHVLVVTALIFSVSANASPLPEYPFVFATGTAEIQIEPDTAELTFTFSARHALEGEALNAVQAGSKSVLTILSDSGVKVEDIDASSINKFELTHWDDDADKFVSGGYEVRREFVVIVRDLTKYPEIGKTLLDLSGTSEFNATFDRTDRDNIEGELFQLAAKDAKARADRMAASFDRTIGAVRAIAQVPIGEIPNHFGVAGNRQELYGAVLTSARRQGKEPDSLLVPATISIAAEVNVVFELK